MKKNLQLTPLASTCAAAVLFTGCQSETAIVGAHPSGDHASTRVANVPPARRSAHSDTYHGKRVADPYRWMEEPGDELDAWLQAQDALLADYTADATGAVDLAARILELSSFDSRSTPSRYGGFEFHSRTASGAKAPSIWIAPVGDEDAARMLFDGTPEDADLAFRGSYAPSHEGRYVAINLDPGPTLHDRARVLDTTTGAFLPDEIPSLWGSPSWTADEQGFFYMRFPERSEDDVRSELGRPQVMHHELGSSSEDTVVFELPDEPGTLLRKRVTRDGAYLLVTGSEGSNFSGMAERLWIRDLNDPQSELRPFLDGVEGGFAYEGNDGSTFFFRTTVGAPMKRLVAIDLTQPDPSHWREIVAESADPLQAVSTFPGAFVLQYTRDANVVVRVVGRDGSHRFDVDAPGGGRLGGFGDNRFEDRTFYSVGALYDPGSVYELDLTSGESTLAWRPELAVDPDAFETRQIFYTAEDGTRIPMSVVGPKGFEAGDPRPLFLYAYGALGWAAFPWYQPHLIVWLERGGLYALPNVRGGGEYGDAWADAGKRRNKPVGIADYCAAASALIDEGYTTPELLVANGASASGVLAAAAMQRTPERFGAAWIDVPKLDMLRYHHFGGSAYTIPDFGTSEDPDDFAVLLEYSPLHNVEADASYPPTLVTVGERDLTAPPLHGYKFIAELQARAADGSYFLQLCRDAGHNHGDTPEERARVFANAFRFLFVALGLDESAG